MQQSITDRIQSLDSNLIFVRPGQANFVGVFDGQGSATTLTLAPEITTNAQLVAGRENTSTQVVGVTPPRIFRRAQLSCFIRLVHPISTKS